MQLKSAFDHNVAAAVAVLAECSTLPGPDEPLGSYPPSILHLGIIVLREARLIVADRRARAKAAAAKRSANVRQRHRRSEIRRARYLLHSGRVDELEAHLRECESRARRTHDFALIGELREMRGRL